MLSAAARTGGRLSSMSGVVSRATDRRGGKRPVRVQQVDAAVNEQSGIRIGPAAVVRAAGAQPDTAANPMATGHNRCSRLMVTLLRLVPAGSIAIRDAGAQPATPPG
jgi:hypothetical protein